MRIFQVIESSTNSSLPDNRTWYRNLYEPLVEMGHEVILCPAEMGRQAKLTDNIELKHKFSQEMMDLFCNEHKKRPFDLAFFYLMDGMFERWAIEGIHKSNVITCNFSCNNIHQFYLVEKISDLFDWNLHSEKEAAVKFKNIGVNALWWPMASNPKYFHPMNVSRTIPVSFVGAKYGRRLESIYQLLIAGIDVHTYGPNWEIEIPSINSIQLLREIKHLILEFPNNLKEKAVRSAEKAQNDLHALAISQYPNNFHGPVSDDQLIQLYSESKISLGSLDVFENHNLLGRRLRHLHLREFEAPMSGALYCTDFSDELAEMFEPDKEVIMCHDDIERTDKISFYLRNETLANKIREAGLRRSLADHTYHQRFHLLFKKLGLKNSG